jgi:hypothetical protein
MSLMKKAQDNPATPSGQPEVAAAGTSAPTRPDQKAGREEDAPSTSPEGTSAAQESRDQHDKTSRRPKSIVSGARREDEQPPFSDD